jgi:hypothetical protein
MKTPTPYRMAGETRTAQPSAEQLRSLRQFVADQGENWKQAIFDCWNRGVYPMYGYDYGTITAHIQQIRNQFGPAWLQTWTPPARLPKPKHFGYAPLNRRHSDRRR